MKNRRQLFGSSLARIALAIASVSTAVHAQEFVFEPPLRSEASPNAVTVLTADIGGSASLDLLVNAVTTSGETPAVHFGLGDGTFGAGLSIGGSAGSIVTDVGDFDEDGAPDLLVVNVASPDSVLFLRLGNGDGTFGPELLVPTGLNPNLARFGDFDDDEHLDVLVARTGDVFFNRGDFSVFFGAGDGTLSVPTIFELDGLGATLDVADMNGDLVDDVVTFHIDLDTGVKSFDVYLGSPARSFTKTPTCANCVVEPMRTVMAPVLGDFDADGDVDVAFGSTWISGMTPQFFTVAVRLNDGAGNLSAGTDVTGFGIFDRIITGDIDGDDDDDLMLSSAFSFTGPAGGQAVPNGEIKFVRMQDALAESGPALFVTAPGSRIMAAQDADEDGRLDFVGLNHLTDSVDVLLNATYRATEPFVDLGDVLPASHGYPVQLAAGTLVPGSTFRHTLRGGIPNGEAILVVGFQRANRPFRAGVLVPRPELLVRPLSIDANGEAHFLGNVPFGLTGLQLYAQFWFRDAGGFAGFGATTAVESTFP